MSLAQQLAAEFDVPVECAEAVIDYVERTLSENILAREIGAEMGITRQGVLKIEHGALRKLRRKPLARQLFRELDT